MNQTKRILGAVTALAAVAILAFVVIPSLLPNLRPLSPLNTPAPVNPKEPVNQIEPVNTKEAVEIPSGSDQVITSGDDQVIVTFAAFSWQLGEYGLLEEYESIAAEFHKQHPEITVQIREQPLTPDARQIACGRHHPGDVPAFRPSATSWI
jgi:ABC-type glycerol-3-phosphate transport system substrate-binding protein